MTLNIHLFCTLLLFGGLNWIIHCSCQKPSVSLTVDGADSLIGPQCPGTVRLVCKGVDLTSLRWSYNGNIEIETFFPDSPSGSDIPLNNAAFLSVILISTTPNEQIPEVANFSSILTVDLSQLQSENVMEIECSGPFTAESIPVNVSIIRQNVPETPTITAITATYVSGMLSSVEVTWMKLFTTCSEYEFSLIYEVQLTGTTPARLNHTSCNDINCTSNFTLPEKVNITDHEVTIFALNPVGSSDVSVYPQSIEHQSQLYFTTEVTANECRIQGRCVPFGDHNGTCFVQYTNNPQYSRLQDVIQTDPFSISGLTSNTDYYLEFSAIVNESLQFLVVNRMQIRINQCMDSVAIIIAASVVSVVLLLIITTIIVVGILVCKSFFCGSQDIEDKHRDVAVGNNEVPATQTGGNAVTTMEQETSFVTVNMNKSSSH